MKRLCRSFVRNFHHYSTYPHEQADKGRSQSIFDQAEEIVVVASAGDLFHPTIAFNEMGSFYRGADGQLQISPEIVARFPQVAEQLNLHEILIKEQVQSAVARLHVVFDSPDGGSAEHWFPTAYATSPST